MKMPPVQCNSERREGKEDFGSNPGKQGVQILTRSNIGERLFTMGGQTQLHASCLLVPLVPPLLPLQGDHHLAKGRSKCSVSTYLPDESEGEVERDLELPVTKYIYITYNGSHFYFSRE